MDRLHRKRAYRASALVEALEPRTLLSYTFSSVASFRGVINGTPPSGLVMDSSGNLFGVTAAGGAKGYGAIVELAQGSGTLTTLYSFTGTSGVAPGIAPRGQLVLEDGNLYGITTGGGTSGKGTLFEVANVGLGTASTFHNLVSFNGANGSFPLAGLSADAAGNLYGTTLGANANGFASTAFEFAFAGSPGSTGTLSVLATLHTADQPNGTLVVDSSGNIFGTTLTGGPTSQGTIFKLSGSAHTMTTLASFNGTNGSRPDGTLLMNAQGDLIGLTATGGAGGTGTLFKVPATASSTIVTLASFNGTNGSRPVGDLIIDGAGNIFGTTSVGGANSIGNVFELPATASSITSLYSFSSQATGYNPTGALVVDGAGAFWGVTYSGGKNNAGTVFELQPTVAAPAAQPAAQLIVTRQPSAVTAGARFTLVIKLEDAAGHLLNSSAQISLTLASGPAGAIFGGTHTVSFVHGVATFSNLVLRPKGTYTLDALSGALELVTRKIVVR